MSAFYAQLYPRLNRLRRPSILFLHRMVPRASAVSILDTGAGVSIHIFTQLNNFIPFGSIQQILIRIYIITNRVFHLIHLPTLTGLNTVETPTELFTLTRSIYNNFSYIANSRSSLLLSRNIRVLVPANRASILLDALAIRAISVSGTIISLGINHVSIRALRTCLCIFRSIYRCLKSLTRSLYHIVLACLRILPPSWCPVFTLFPLPVTVSRSLFLRRLQLRLSSWSMLKHDLLARLRSIRSRWWHTVFTIYFALGLRFRRFRDIGITASMSFFAGRLILYLMALSIINAYVSSLNRMDYFFSSYLDPSYMFDDSALSIAVPLGGAKTFPASTLQPYCLHGTVDSNKVYLFDSCMYDHDLLSYERADGEVLCDIPLTTMADTLTLRQLFVVMDHHSDISLPDHTDRNIVVDRLKTHSCVGCKPSFSLFRVSPISARQRAITARKPRKDRKDQRSGPDDPFSDQRDSCIFPPSPVTMEQMEQTVRNYCEALNPDNFVETGCAVCGRLFPCKELRKLSEDGVDLSLLLCPDLGMTRKERLPGSAPEPVSELEGPIIDINCSHICGACDRSLVKGKMPKNALARGLWLGDVPDALKDLSLPERLMICKIRHNRFVVRVARGAHKMITNAVAFEQPVHRIYTSLPPKLSELGDILAVVFTGPEQPSDEDFRRTPMLVRRDKVKSALEWLKLNNRLYEDVTIDAEALKSYPEDKPPVAVEYRESHTNRTQEATSQFDMEEELGTEDSAGPSPFVVSGLTGLDYDKKTSSQKIGLATRHLNLDGKAMLVGRDSLPQSLFHNPDLYPQMFPWLFPYGLGGIGQEHIKRHSTDAHKAQLLMYHDKRFQMDPFFIIAAFNHTQIQTASRHCHLASKRENFKYVAERLLSIDPLVVRKIADRMAEGEHVPKNELTDEESRCFEILKDIDTIGGYVDGSITSKKYMRNQISSLLYYYGAPSWFVTMSPSDSNHPLCLYYADTKEEFRPELKYDNEALALIAKNPVAAARFFHKVVELFIEHVLGVKHTSKGTKYADGLFGPTAAYYGTVEQQGRLTLHLHTLVWIRGALSPQEIRDRLMDGDSDFQKALIAYLEGCHQGEFMNETFENVQQKKTDNENNKHKPDSSYRTPLETLPLPPPSDVCRNKGGCVRCPACVALDEWRGQFKDVVNDILIRCHLHVCRGSKQVYQKKEAMSKSGFRPRGNDRPETGCRSNTHGICKARFPRPIFLNSEVDPLTGAINMRHLEPQLNDFLCSMTYLMRCNTDVTSLMSGTAIKAVIAYVSDYVSKAPLKTYSIFDTIHSVFSKNSEYIGGTQSEQDKARRLLVQLVNGLSAKMEIGSPMAAMYLLKNPDYYTASEFSPFYWMEYVAVVRKAHQMAADDMEDQAPSEKIMLQAKKDKLIGLSRVDDYRFRSSDLDAMSLFDFMRLGKKVRTVSKKPAQDLIDPDNVLEREIDNTDDADADKKEYRFEEGHPQRDTHCVVLRTGDQFAVPDFIGKGLPRRDVGDREYYCASMLTFFSPWRSGLELKTQDETWDQAFSRHEWEERIVKVQNNFNLKYECLDARDDFSKQRRNNRNEMPAPWSGVPADGYETDDYADGNEEAPGDFFGFDIYEAMFQGPKTTKRDFARKDAERLMKNAGFDTQHEPCNNATNIVPDFDLNVSGTTWKALLEKARDEAAHVVRAPSSDEIVRERNNAQAYNGVKWVSRDYLNKSFVPDQLTIRDAMDNIVRDRHLNTEQERAFRIIANHSTSRERFSQLKMYLGGVGGTGKSTVIKAVTDFFESQNQRHRLLLLAPTGSSASVIGGITLHSALQMRDNLEEQKSQANMKKVVETFRYVDYIFIDEVSMLSQSQLYEIASQLARATGSKDQPFGGKNVIFAGDFAQLPPVVGQALYAASPTQGKSMQECVIGRALWHQVVTVVILRQNMRQRSESSRDVQFRTAMGNMRYGACTPADITFLNTLVGNSTAADRTLANQKFRHVSVITHWNAKKDRINEVGCEDFAVQTGQTLTCFYSEDHLVDPARGNRKKHKSKSQFKSRRLSDKQRNLLWSLPSSASANQEYSQLPLCIGMPVIIRENLATPLGVTNGQEATVVGWKSSPIASNSANDSSAGRLKLDVLFVKLIRNGKDDRPVQIPGLKENIVPLHPVSRPTRVMMPNDEEISIQRKIVPVLPNFAMTDYACQGKTREYNVVDVRSCRDVQSIYTCLSRGTTADGTFLLEPIEAHKITKKISGYLRQEFRELELLDDITRMAYEGALPLSVNGLTRNTVINRFRTWKGKYYVPVNVPGPIRWNIDSNDFPDQVPEDASQYRLQSKNGAIDIRISPCQSSDPSTEHHGYSNVQGSKRKFEYNQSNTTSKKLKIDNPSVSFAIGDSPSNTGPIGHKWDGDSYSCAYDSTLFILANLWASDPVKWTASLSGRNDVAASMASGWTDVVAGKKTLNSVRDDVRNFLFDMDSDTFPKGHRGASLDDLAVQLTRSEMEEVQTFSCSNLLCSGKIKYSIAGPHHLFDYLGLDKSMQAAFDNKYKDMDLASCPKCGGDLDSFPIHDIAPSLFFVNVYSDGAAFDIPTTVIARCDRRGNVTLRICGLLYAGGFHFTARFCRPDGSLWYHDSIDSSPRAVRDGSLSNGSTHIFRANNRTLHTVVYAEI